MGIYCRHGKIAEGENSIQKENYNNILNFINQGYPAGVDWFIGFNKL